MVLGNVGCSQQVCAALQLRALPSPVQQHPQPVIRGPSCKCQGRAREAITHVCVQLRHQPSVHYREILTAKQDVATGTGLFPTKEKVRHATLMLLLNI